MNPSVETPSFTFRLERVRSLRERAEERAREALAQELALRLRGAAVLEQALAATAAARDNGLAAQRSGAPAGDLLATQLWIERSERVTREAAHDLDRQDAEVAARRAALSGAAREREVIEKLKRRKAADHEREWARRAQNELDEIALGVHRRGRAAA
jgi:flagellar FliJ protein